MALLRVSSAEQGADSRGGLPRQREVVNRTIAAKNLDCIDWIELVDVSGTSTSTHPAIRDVLRRILNGEVRGLVMADIDRLFRPTEPANFAMLQVFKDVGAKIYSGDFEYDLTTGSGMLFSSIRSAFAGFELSLMRDRQQGAKEAKRRLGRCPTNALTLPTGIGYDRATETWRYTPEIGLVTELFRLFDGGLHNYCELGRRTGLNHATVRCILRNPVYTGWRVIDKKRGAKRTSRTGKTYREKTRRDDSEVIRVKVLDGVISEETFARVQAEMQRIRFNHLERRTQDEAVNLGAGVACCGHCGQPLLCSSGKRAGRGKRQGYYTCKSNHYLYKARLRGCRQPHLRQSELDEAIHRLVADVLRSPQHLARIVQSSVACINKVVTPMSVNHVGPSANIQELRRRDQRLLDAYEEGAITIDELRTKRADIRRATEALARMAQKPTTETGPDLLRLARLVVKGGMRYARIADAMQRKRIITDLFAEILVRDYAIIGFRFRDAIMCPFGMEDNPSILLPKPFALDRRAVPQVVEGKKQCIKCQQRMLVEDFYRNLNVCNGCRNAEARERYRRRKGRSAAEPRGTSGQDTHDSVGNS